MKVLIEFDTGGTAFEDDECAEISAILKRQSLQAMSASVVKNCALSLDGKPIRDSYGNTVGTITVKEG